MNFSASQKIAPLMHTFFGCCFCFVFCFFTSEDMFEKLDIYTEIHRCLSPSFSKGLAQTKQREPKLPKCTGCQSGLLNTDMHAQQIMTESTWQVVYFLFT